MTRVSSNPFTIQVQGTGTGTQTGWTFPSNGALPNAFVAFQFLNPHLNGLPIWGPNGSGTTFIWKAKYRQQTGYYTAWWWGNNGEYWWDHGSPNTYYGCHPFPDPRQGGLSWNKTAHVFEIGGDFGADQTWTTQGAETFNNAVKDNARWYTQALRTTRNANGSKTHLFYISIPSTSPIDIIQLNLGPSEGETNPPNPAVTFGDSPWPTIAGQSGKTMGRMSGTLRHIKIFNKVLSLADTFAEAQSESLVTSEGQANIWWMKINPSTVDDLTCDAGTGRSFQWANSNKATLWTG